MRRGVCQRRDAAHRATPVTRDFRPSAAFSRNGADAYPAPPTTPCTRTKLTRSGVGASPDPMRGMVCPIAFAMDAAHAAMPGYRPSWISMPAGAGE